MTVLQDFSKGVEERMERDGWIEIIAPIVMPLLVEWINRCLNDQAKLQTYVEVRGSFRQETIKRLGCRSAVSEAGIRGPMRVGRATSALVKAIDDQLEEGRGRMSGDIYQQAVEEAAGLEA